MSLMLSTEYFVLFCLLMTIGIALPYIRFTGSHRERIRFWIALILLAPVTWGLLFFATEHSRIASQVLSNSVSVQRIIFIIFLCIALVLIWFFSRRWKTSLVKLFIPAIIFALLLTLLADTLSGSFRMYIRQILLIHQHQGPEYASNLIATFLASLDITSVTFLYNVFMMILFISGVLLLKTISMKILIFGEGVLISLIVITGLYVQVFNMTLNLEVGYAVDILSQDFTILSFYQFTLLFSIFLAFILSIFSALRLLRLNVVAIAEAEQRKAEEVRQNMIAQQIELERLVKIRTEELAAEHSRSEKLLRNILPEVIAERLKIDESAIADSYEGATVIFADIVNFTPFSAELSPQDLVQMLNRVFSEFDDIADRLGLEKIKTIGDAYMVTAGLPQPRDDHAIVATEMATQMITVMEKLEPIQGQKLQIRIGMNSGPVIAGVIGKKKFAYDLWGDVVNTAARMEAYGIAGRIQMTEATKLLIENTYKIENRGIFDIKGKGKMNLFLLNNRNINKNE